MNWRPTRSSTAPSHRPAPAWPSPGPWRDQLDPRRGRRLRRVGAFKIGNDAIFGAIINAVKSDTTSNLLQAPSVMTLDNQEARILVGQEIPITTGQAL